MTTFTFTATFSNGKTVKRTSHHPYRYAVALVHRETGEFASVKFTASDKPAPDWGGMRYITNRYYSAAERARFNAEKDRMRAEYRIEIVPV